MPTRRPRGSPRFTLLAVLILLTGGMAAAENIDPGDDGSQYAWGEHVGWINARPQGAGGPGMQVDDFGLTGWLWGQDIGWISLSCRNTSSCDANDYGVVNDGGGVLSGYAWGETVGWIDFGPAQGGVTIDLATGGFGGHAWGEHIGWIAFASSGANPFALRTGWECDPAPDPPPVSAGLDAGKSGAAAELTWEGIAGATGYDVVWGDLSLLRSSGFAASTGGCLSDNDPATALSHSAEPSPGDGIWYLMRGENCGGDGSYGSGGPAQAGPRDGGIAASGAACSAVERFVDRGDGTIEDTGTGLVWLKNASCFGLTDWATAQAAAATLADGQCGLTDGSSPGDWRLPTLACPSGTSCSVADATGEFATIFAPGCPYPAILDSLGRGCWSEGDPFSGVQVGSYWSSSDAGDTAHAWYAALHLSEVRTAAKTVAGARMWAVRGGP